MGAVSNAAGASSKRQMSLNGTKPAVPDSFTPCIRKRSRDYTSFGRRNSPDHGAAHGRTSPDSGETIEAGAGWKTRCVSWVPGDSAAREGGRYRCFLPDLTGFAASHCTKPGTQQFILSLRRIRKRGSAPKVRCSATQTGGLGVAVTTPTGIFCGVSARGPEVGSTAFQGHEAAPLFA